MVESEMVSNINNYLLKHGICYSNEIRMGIGIPDISLNLGGNRRIKYIDDYFLFSILNFIIDKKCTTITEIGQKFLFSFEKAKKYVFQLEDMSLVSIKNEIVKALKNIFNTRLGTTISIEAKIKDWKNGYIQAQRYLCFSDFTYLALLEKYINKVDLNILQKKGIGLLSIEDENIVEVLPATKSEKCEFILKYMHTSSIIHRYKNSVTKYIRKKDNLFSKYEYINNL